MQSVTLSHKGIQIGVVPLANLVDGEIIDKRTCRPQRENSMPFARNQQSFGSMAAGFSEFLKDAKSNYSASRAPSADGAAPITLTQTLETLEQLAVDLSDGNPITVFSCPRIRAEGSPNDYADAAVRFRHLGPGGPHPHPINPTLGFVVMGPETPLVCILEEDRTEGVVYPPHNCGPSIVEFFHSLITNSSQTPEREFGFY